MKTSNPWIIELESEEDVLTYRHANGLVLEVGNAVVSGMLNDTPEGIRVFNNIGDALVYLAESIKKQSPLVVANKPGPKPTNSQLRKAKRKPAKKSK